MGTSCCQATLETSFCRCWLSLLCSYDILWLGSGSLLYIDLLRYFGIGQFFFPSRRVLSCSFLLGSALSEYCVTSFQEIGFHGSAPTSHWKDQVFMFSKSKHILLSSCFHQPVSSIQWGCLGLPVLTINLRPPCQFDINCATSRVTLLDLPSKLYRSLQTGVVPNMQPATIVLLKKHEPLLAFAYHLSHSLAPCKVR